MSANRDKTQKIAFVYSNLYQLYRKGKDAAINASTQPQDGIAQAGFVRVSARSGTQVLKTADVREGNPLGIRVREYNPAALIGKRFEKPAFLKAGQESKAAVQVPAHAPLDGLKNNLQALNDLQAKLRFMLQELEELVKE
ncbi:MAG: hypothetical protein AABZ55_11055 [Bdellovibrionota bacterium]